MIEVQVMAFPIFVLTFDGVGINVIATDIKVNSITLLVSNDLNFNICGNKMYAHSVKSLDVNKELHNLYRYY